MSAIIELATGQTDTDDFGSGVNKALAVESKSVFEVKEGKANLRKFAARYEKTEKAQLEMEKFNKLTGSNGGDLEDGTDPTFTVVDNQALVTFNSGFPISVGYKLTPKLLKQARSDPSAFMARYRRKVGFDMAKKEDVYIGSTIVNGATNKVYGGAASATAELGTGSTFDVELFETMLDDMKEREYEPTDFLGTSKVIGQLRRSARQLNNSDFSVAIQEDGSTVTKFGSVMVHEVPGTDILPNIELSGTGSGTYGILMDREGAFGVCDFLKSANASPVSMYVEKPRPAIEGENFHRILGQEEVEAQILDQNAIIVAEVSKA